MSKNLFAQLMANLRQQTASDCVNSTLSASLGAEGLAGVDTKNAGNYAQYLFSKAMGGLLREPMQDLVEFGEIADLLRSTLHYQPSHLYAQELLILLHRNAVIAICNQEDCQALKKARQSLQEQIQAFQEDAKQKCFGREETIALIDKRFNERQEGLIKRQRDICQQVRGHFKAAIDVAMTLKEQQPVIGYFRLAMIYKQWRGFPLNDDLTNSRCNKYFNTYLQKTIDNLEVARLFPHLSIETDDVSEFLACCNDQCNYPGSDVKSFTDFIQNQLQQEIYQQQLQTYSRSEATVESCDKLLDRVLVDSALSSNSLLKDIIQALSMLEATNSQGDLPASMVTTLKVLLVDWQQQLKDFFDQQGVQYKLG